MNTRLEQLEKKIILLDDKDVQLTEFANDAKATSIKLEEKIAELTQQLEKLAARPSAPAAGKPAPSPADVSQGKKHHIVARGETLYSIARRYGRSVDELRQLNNLSQNQTIQAGQKLVVSPEGR
jgi:LysM repeat protein